MVVGNGCKPAALFPNFTYAVPRVVDEIVAREDVNVTVNVGVPPTAYESDTIETFEITPSTVLVIELLVAPLYAMVNV